MIKGLPLCFQRKILIDTLVKIEASRPVVDFDEYKKLRAEQELKRYSCETLIKFCLKG